MKGKQAMAKMKLTRDIKNYVQIQLELAINEKYNSRLKKLDAVVRAENIGAIASKWEDELFSHVEKIMEKEDFKFAKIAFNDYLTEEETEGKIRKIITHCMTDIFERYAVTEERQEYLALMKKRKEDIAKIKEVLVLLEIDCLYGTDGEYFFERLEDYKTELLED